MPAAAHAHTWAAPSLVISAGERVPEGAQAALQGAHFGIWTTTPWTIPANLAVAVNDALEYAVVEVQVGGQGTCWGSLCRPVAS